jgi:DNA/RNA non-specific endonuclease
MPRRRRTGSLRLNSLSSLLLIVLVAGLGYLLVQRGALPAPPSPTRKPPATRHAPATRPPATPPAQGPADNRAAIARLGGSVDYGRIDPATGQRSGISATITPAMIAAAARHQLGSAAASSIRPPGFDHLPTRNRARGHLLGRQLGGSGELAANLVALYQTRANTPVMRDYETAVADAVEAGETIRYTVSPIYPSRTSTGPPSAIRLTATGNRGFRMDVTIANTPQAGVTETIPPPARP